MRMCAERRALPGAARRYFGGREEVSIAKHTASHTSLISQHAGASAGASFGLNEREWRPRGCAQSNGHHPDLQIDSLVAVWELV